MILDLPDVSCETVNEAESTFVAGLEIDSVVRIEEVLDEVPSLL